MKGPFFINFLVVMCCIAAVSILLWLFIARPRHKTKIFFGGMVLTAMALGCIAWYGAEFGYFSSYLEGWFGFYGSLTALSWLFVFLLALPILLLAAFFCALYRLGKRVREVPISDQTASLSREVPEGRWVSRGMTRREFLKYAALSIPVLALVTGGLGNFIGEAYLATTRHTFRFADLPDYLDGYKIGQISDVHMGLFFSPQRLQEAFDALADAGVDRVELTGDLIDELSLLPQFQDVVLRNEGRFPDGIDFCYGNHEYYRSFDRITAMLEGTPVRILRNSAIEISPGRGGGLARRSGTSSRPFYIAGTDFGFARGDAAFKAQREEYVEEALSDVPADAFVVLLSHHPDFFDEAAERGVELTLAGHTHGAQFAPIGPIVQSIGFKYLRGLYQKGRSVLYVNRGTGHWLPFRVFCSREVSVFTLKRA